MTTASGRAQVGMMAVFGQLERDIGRERTKAALAIKKAQGVRLGRPPTLPGEVVERIRAEREAGRTWTAIAEGLNADGVPTAHGGQRWYPTTVTKASGLPRVARGPRRERIVLT